MKNRCYNENADRYSDYGGRGITIYEEWLFDFDKFSLWAYANGYKPGLTIDRKDNNDGYYPWNCRWITKAEQNRNRRDNLFVTAFGETKICADWESDSRCIVPAMTFRSRIYSGMRPELALTKPAIGFTEKEKDFIRNNFRTMEDKEISKIIGKSVSKIASWRFNSGLTKFNARRNYNKDNTSKSSPTKL